MPIDGCHSGERCRPPSAGRLSRTPSELEITGHPVRWLGCWLAGAAEGNVDGRWKTSFCPTLVCPPCRGPLCPYPVARFAPSLWTARRLLLLAAALRGSLDLTVPFSLALGRGLERGC